MLKQKNSRVIFFVMSLLVVLIDQLSKWLAIHYLHYQTPYFINSFFNFYLDSNKGAAFSFLGKQSGWQIWFFGLISLLVSVSITIYLWRAHTLFKITGFGLCLILGGAVGNLIDRVRFHAVIDFISWHVGSYYWPTFNVADSAVCIGVLLLFFKQLGSRHP